MIRCVRLTLLLALLMSAAGCGETARPRGREPAPAPSPFDGRWGLETLSGRRVSTGVPVVEVGQDGRLYLRGCGDFGGTIRAGTPPTVEPDGMPHGCDEAAWRVQRELLALIAARPEVSLLPPSQEPCVGAVCPCSTDRLAMRADGRLATFCNITIFEE